MNTLYGTPLSLYAGRARSYLIKAGVDYRETTPISAHYKNVVLPLAGGRQSMPTLETDQGQVIRDGAAIIDHFEANSGFPFSPLSPKQRLVSRLFDVIGAEGLLRPAMHYRWDFPEQNLDFLTFHFESVMPRNAKRKMNAEATADRMRNAGMNFGAVPETFDLVESLYSSLLKKLDLHFGEYPYLLGGKPCIGDFGLIAPFYGHLGRDPKPLALMQAEAIRLFRWVERMNRPEPDIGEFEDQTVEYHGDDVISASLIDVLKQVAVDFVPETAAACLVINDWLAQQSDLPSGSEVARGVGMCAFDVDGITIKALAQPYRFYLLKRVQDEFDSLNAEVQVEVRQFLASCNMDSLLDMKLTRDIGRTNNLEVWS